MGDNIPPNPPGSLPDVASGEERAAHDAATAAYMKAAIDKQKRYNTLWCNLATVLDSTSLMLIRQNCVDNKGLGDGREAWVLLQQKFRSDESVTVVSAMRQLAHLQLKDDEALLIYFIRAQELSKRLEHAENIFRTLAKRDGAQRLARALWTLCGAGNLQPCRQICGASKKTDELRRKPYSSGVCGWCGFTWGDDVQESLAEA